MPVITLLLALLVWTAASCTLAAEGALSITVNPSGIEDDGARNRERLEGLVRRFDQTEHAFRHICVSCGITGRDDSVAPFEPLATLARRSGEPGTSRRTPTTKDGESVATEAARPAPDAQEGRPRSAGGD